MILDTSVFIDYFRGRPEAAAVVLQARSEGTVFMHAVVASELIGGVLNKAELRRCLALVGGCRLVLPDASDIRRSLAILERFTLSHRMSWTDCVIAATATRLGEPVVTLDLKHFPLIKGLQVIQAY